VDQRSRRNAAALVLAIALLIALLMLRQCGGALPGYERAVLVPERSVGGATTDARDRSVADQADGGETPVRAWSYRPPLAQDTAMPAHGVGPAGERRRGPAAVRRSTSSPGSPSEDNGSPPLRGGDPAGAAREPVRIAGNSGVPEVGTHGPALSPSVPAAPASSPATQVPPAGQRWRLPAAAWFGGGAATGAAALLILDDEIPTDSPG
jgi:hypothetical protein